MAKYVKLGEKASSFYDPSTGFKVSGDKVKEVTKEMQVSKKFKKAIKGGHLEWAEAGEFVKEIEVDEEADTDSNEQFTEGELMSKSKEALVNLAWKAQLTLDEEDQLSEEKLAKKTKAELAELILESYEEEEE